MENNELIFQAGYAQGVFTPPLGLNIPGYFERRISDGVINDLLMHCVAFDNGTDKALYFACDAQAVITSGGKAVRKLLSETYDIPEKNIFTMEYFSELRNITMDSEVVLLLALWKRLRSFFLFPTKILRFSLYKPILFC